MLETDRPKDSVDLHCWGHRNLHCRYGETKIVAAERQSLGANLLRAEENEKWVVGPTFSQTLGCSSGEE